MNKLRKAILVMGALTFTSAANASLKCEKESSVLAFRLVTQGLLASGGNVKPVAVNAKSVTSRRSARKGQLTRVVLVQVDEINDSYTKPVIVTLKSANCEEIEIEELMEPGDE